MSKKLLLASALLAAAVFVCVVTILSPAKSSDGRAAATLPPKGGSPQKPSRARLAPNSRDPAAHSSSTLPRAKLLTMTPGEWTAYFATRTEEGLSVSDPLQEEIIDLARELPSLDPLEAEVYHLAIRGLLQGDQGDGPFGPVRPGPFPSSDRLSPQAKQ